MIDTSSSRTMRPGAWVWRARWAIGLTLVAAAVIGAGVAVGITRAQGNGAVPAIAVVQAAGSHGTATATCGAGQELLGGGFSGSVPHASYPRSSAGWTVASYATASVTAFALCVRSGSLGAIQIVQSSSVAVTGDAESAAVASCPTGTTIAGGGFQAAHDDPFGVTGAQPVKNTWTVTARTLRQPAQSLQAYAICVPSRAQVGAINSTSLGSDVLNHAGAAILSCPANTFLSGGGFTYAASPYLHINQDAPSADAVRWTVQVSGNAGESGTAWLICLGG